jgi:hypothetical protein
MSTFDTTQDNSYKTDKYKIKIKTINKEFLDKDTKLQIELIDENGKSIMNQIENNLQKENIDTITLDTNKDFGKVKNLSFFI